MSILAVNEQTFKKTIEQDDLVLVDFWAPWCGPCKMIAPILEQLNEQTGGKLTIAKVNVDENPEVTSQHGVMSIPTLKLFKNGAEVQTLVGVKPLDTLIQLVRQYES